MMKSIPIGLAGFGSVGQELAKILAAGSVPGAHIAAVSAQDLEKAAAAAASISSAIEVVPLARLPSRAEIFVECATASAFPEIARTVVGAGKTLIGVSIAGMLDLPEIGELARATGGRLHLASGALPGLDIVRAIKERGINNIKLTSRIRPASMAKENYILNSGFDLENLGGECITVFEGNARDAAKAFPRHFNVAIALSLAGAGFDDTNVKIVADPAVDGPIHHIDAVGVDAELTLESRNRSSVNPRTARLVAPSLIAAIRSYVDPIRVGT